ncbi:MAG: DUF6262 family protein [Bdellovibrionia bacterium]
MSHTRNTLGLKENAKNKSKNTEIKVETAIRQMLKDCKPITYNSVARVAGVSIAWCYRNEKFRERIALLRAKTGVLPKSLVPQSERLTSASKEALLEMFKRRIADQNKEISELRKQLEVVYGELKIYSNMNKHEIESKTKTN